MSKSDGSGWSDILWFALLYYPVAGFFFYLSHRDEAPKSLAWVLFVLSPLLIAAGGAITLGLCMLALVGFTRMCESQWFKRYWSVLENAEAKSKAAQQQGRQMASWGWKLVWLVVALPILAVLLQWVMSAE